MAKLVVGINDLATLHPEVAAEADGWDPKNVHSGSHSKMSWKCKKGHTWSTQVKHRTTSESGCPYCSNQKVWVGFNDLKTLFPDIAQEADGWDPTTVVAGSHRKMSWKCTKAHTWKATIGGRTKGQTGCPYCSNNYVWNGFNDLKTLFPDIAKEANGWDPATIIPGSNKKMSWKCKKGHTWSAVVDSRTGLKKSGCPYCTNQLVWNGFNDVHTLFPNVAKEANGWNPSTVLAGSKRKMSWKC